MQQFPYASTQITIDLGIYHKGREYQVLLVNQRITKKQHRRKGNNGDG